MVFGFGNNTAPSRTSGFRPSTANQGWNPFQGAKNSLLNVLNAEIPYQTVFAGFVRAGQSISNFDFNATDQELKSQIQNHNIILASALGGVVGRGIGSAISVGGAGLAGLTVPKISSTALAKRLIQATSEEAKDEIVGEVKALLNVTTSLFANRVLIEGYINLRSILKKQPLIVLERFFDPATAKYIKEVWGTDQAPPLILSDTIEEKIESIDNLLIQNFVEEAYEETLDTIIELGFVIAQELDTALAEFQLQQNQQEESITIQTISDEPDSEKFVIEGNDQNQIIQSAQNTIQNWRILQNRDVGQIVTQNLEILETHPQPRRMEVIFKSVPFYPLYNPDGTKAIQSQMSIPNIKRNLTYREIVRTLKRNSSVPTFYYGDTVALLRFTDKRKIMFNYDAVSMNKSQIENLLKDFAELSTGLVKTIKASETLEQPRDNRKRVIGMYPFSAKIIAQDLRNIDRSSALKSPTLTYEFPLWTENEPEDFLFRMNLLP